MARKTATRTKRRPKTPTIKPRLPMRKIIVTLSENGTPRRRAEIPWPRGRNFTVKNLAAWRDCGSWILMRDWLVRIHEGEDE